MRLARTRRPSLAPRWPLLLAACSTASDLLEGKKVDYKSAGQLPTLEIPPDLTTPARDNRYVVPDTGKSSATLSGYQADRAQQAKTGNVTAGVLPDGREDARRARRHAALAGGAPSRRRSSGRWCAISGRRTAS